MSSSTAESAALAHLRGALDVLDSGETRGDGASLDAALAAAKPSFRDSNEGLLLHMARSMTHASEGAQSPSNAEVLGEWLERLMLFVEVRRPELRSRFAARWPEPCERLRGILLLSAALLAGHLYFRDLRYLNTALKLGECVALRELRVTTHWHRECRRLHRADSALSAGLRAALEDVEQRVW